MRTGAGTPLGLQLAPAGNRHRLAVEKQPIGRAQRSGQAVPATWSWPAGPSSATEVQGIGVSRSHDIEYDAEVGQLQACAAGVSRLRVKSLSGRADRRRQPATPAHSTVSTTVLRERPCLAGSSVRGITVAAHAAAASGVLLGTSRAQSCSPTKATRTHAAATAGRTLTAAGHQVALYDYTGDPQTTSSRW